MCTYGNVKLFLYSTIDSDGGIGDVKQMRAHNIMRGLEGALYNIRGCVAAAAVVVVVVVALMDPVRFPELLQQLLIQSNGEEYFCSNSCTHYLHAPIRILLAPHRSVGSSSI
jgi:hypothetical protein